MNWFTFILSYLPPLISIYLILISGFTDKYLENLVHNYDTQNATIKQNETFIKDVALDWSERLGFFNSMLVSLTSCISIFSAQDYGIAFVTFVLLLCLYFGMFLWIISHSATDLVSTWMRHLKIRKVTFCHIILIIVNLVLIGEIFLIQNVIPASTAAPK